MTKSRHVYKSHFTRSKQRPEHSTPMITAPETPRIPRNTSVTNASALEWDGQPFSGWNQTWSNQPPLLSANNLSQGDIVAPEKEKVDFVNIPNMDIPTSEELFEATDTEISISAINDDEVIKGCGVENSPQKIENSHITDKASGGENTHRNTTLLKKTSSSSTKVPEFLKKYETGNPLREGLKAADDVTIPVEIPAAKSDSSVAYKRGAVNGSRYEKAYEQLEVLGTKVLEPDISDSETNNKSAPNINKTDKVAGDLPTNAPKVGNKGANLPTKSHATAAAGKDLGARNKYELPRPLTDRPNPKFELPPQASGGAKQSVQFSSPLFNNARKGPDIPNYFGPKSYSQDARVLTSNKNKGLSKSGSEFGILKSESNKSKESSTWGREAIYEVSSDKKREPGVAKNDVAEQINRAVSDAMERVRAEYEDKIKRLSSNKNREEHGYEKSKDKIRYSNSDRSDSDYTDGSCSDRSRHEHRDRVGRYKPDRRGKSRRRSDRESEYSDSYTESSRGSRSEYESMDDRSDRRRRRRSGRDFGVSGEDSESSYAERRDGGGYRDDRRHRDNGGNERRFTSRNTSDTDDVDSSSERARRSRGRRERHRSNDLTAAERTILRSAGFSREEFEDRAEQSFSGYRVANLPGVPASNFVVNLSPDSLEPFSGKMEDYESFRGDFMSIAEAIPQSQRLRLLKKNVVGTSAENAIARCTGISRAAFDKAVSILDNKFDQPDILVQILIHQIENLMDTSCVNDDVRFSQMIADIRSRYNRIFEVRAIKAIAVDGMLPRLMSCLPRKAYDRACDRRYRKPRDYTFAKVLKIAEDYCSLRESQSMCPERRETDHGFRSGGSSRNSSGYTRNHSSDKHRPRYDRSPSSHSHRSSYDSRKRSSSFRNSQVAEVKVEVESVKENKSSVHKGRSVSRNRGDERTKSRDRDHRGRNTERRDRSSDSFKRETHGRSISRARSHRSESGSRVRPQACNLCSVDDHNTVSCEVEYSTEKLQSLVSERSLCLACGSMGHRAKFCPIVRCCPNSEFLCNGSKCKKFSHCTKFCPIMSLD